MLPGERYSARYRSTPYTQFVLDQQTVRVSSRCCRFHLRCQFLNLVVTGFLTTHVPPVCKHSMAIRACEYAAESCAA